MKKKTIYRYIYVMAYINGMFVTKWDYINIFTWKIKESVMIIKVILITNSTKTQIIRI